MKAGDARRTIALLAFGFFGCVDTFEIPSRRKIPPLPDLPELIGVRARVRGDNVAIAFDPVDGAKDYRVYVLPERGSVSVDASGDASIVNGTYRCAGVRVAPRVATDLEPSAQSEAMRTLVEHGVEGVSRTLDDATLGYVFATPGPERVPVFALGDPSPDADNHCYFQRWKASRAKVYTADAAERAALLAQRWRDDGPLFYVPTKSSNPSVQVASADSQTGGRLYFTTASAEAATRKNARPVFEALAAPQPGTQPLMRLYYQNGCGKSHDELVVGKTRFENARTQGVFPSTQLTWAGVDKPTTLVVEALDAQCPNLGFLAPAALPASPPHPQYQTADQLRLATAHRELFVNGQGDSGNRPRAIARSLLEVAPLPPQPLDWFEGFGTALAPFNRVGTAFQSEHQRSVDYDVFVQAIDNNAPGTLQLAVGGLLGELYFAYGDWASGSSGKTRFAPLKSGALSESSFLYVTYQLDGFVTARRYAQLLLSTRPPPIQDTLEQGVTLILQPSPGGWPSNLELQLCDHTKWDPGAMCKKFSFYPSGSAGLPLPPVPELSELATVESQLQLEVYASTSRVFVVVDDQPYGCAELPVGVFPSGPVSVTFGDTLFNSAQDLIGFEKAFAPTFQNDTRHHFDNLGFKAGVAAPAWDFTRIPCVSTLQ
jgi:hypothetical protein